MMEISRNKQEPTWAMVWNDELVKYKRIIVDIFANGSCLCVCDLSNEKYMTNEFYETKVFQHYEIIKPKSWRALKDMEEFKKEFIKRDVRIINKTRCDIYSILYVGVDRVRISNENHSVETLFSNYTWLDGSPIGVEE